MIVREIPATDGVPACLTLIAQTEHASLAQQLAWHWAGLPFGSSFLQTTLLPVLAHHDDGWSDWDAAPAVDPHLGRPYAFTEMPLVESLDIWSRSILACETYGPLGGWLVAQHFLALLSHSENAQQPQAGDWMRQQQAACVNWLSTWQAEQAENSAALADAALASLQFFDRLSLWFCCSASPAPFRAESPSSGAVSFRQPQRGQVLVSPWPFDGDGFSVEVASLRVAAQDFSSAVELALAPHEIVDLSWELIPW
ncbi:MAG: DUF3891 family protein [Planctomycetales bacterium]|nr:DUF3891 family protein [Planctomycetales bacterium]